VRSTNHALGVRKVDFRAYLHKSCLTIAEIASFLISFKAHANRAYQCVCFQVRIFPFTPGGLNQGHLVRRSNLDSEGATVSDNLKTNVSDNAAGAIAYITMFPALIFLFLPPYSKSPYIRFHAWQSIVLDIVLSLVILVLNLMLAPSLMAGGPFFFTVTQLIWGLWILVWVLCAVGALSGRRFKLPLIGALAERLTRA
jgi:uncharacterized membrane protein